MTLSKNLLIKWLSTDFYIDAVLPFADKIPMTQYTVCKRTKARQEAFPGVTEAICEYVASDAVSDIFSVVRDKDKLIVTVTLRTVSSTQSEDSQ